jgi:hypothetical protein
MITGTPYPFMHRMWFVPGVVAWGLPGLDEIEFVAVEEGESETSVFYGSALPGGSEQPILYEELIDHRGNHLPAELSSPRVIVRPRGANAAYVAGPEDQTSFRLARDPSTADPVTADLLIIEMGD